MTPRWLSVSPNLKMTAWRKAVGIQDPLGALQILRAKLAILEERDIGARKRAWWRCAAFCRPTE